MEIYYELIFFSYIFLYFSGNRTYGLICYLVFLVPMLGYLIVCIYLASWTKDDFYTNQTNNFGQFFLNSKVSFVRHFYFILSAKRNFIYIYN